jgi:uncharacterized protein YqgC (DUF456 family)
MSVSDIIGQIELPIIIYFRPTQIFHVDTVWIILGIILVIIGLVGSFLPFLPGPPLAYAGLWIQQLRDDKPFSIKFLLIWAGITAIILFLDYIIPIYGTKKYGGSKYGIWGCAIGFIAAFWLGPLGIIIGPFIGAFIGELIAHQDSSKALKAATGSFIGFLFGSLLKLIACLVMGYYLVVSF